MREDLAVRDAMTREFVGVSEGDDVAGIAALMREADVDGAVVLRGSEAVGVVDARDIVELVAEEVDLTDVRAGAVVSADLPTIDPDRGLTEARSVLAGGDARRLVVTDGAEVIGTLSEHDVLVAQSTFPAVEAPDRPMAVAGSDSGPDDRFSTQSVCEACGALAGSLANVNGQLLCGDCRGL